MEVFLAMVIFGVIFAVVTAANRSAQRLNRAWAEAAGRLGLDFSPGTTFKRRAIRGSRGAIRVELTEKSGGNNNTVREWRLAYPSTPFSMTLTVETPGKKLLKAFGAQDFELGDTAFDAKFMVAGSDQAAITHYLDSGRRASLVKAAERLPGIKVTNSDISWRTTTQYKDAESLIEDAKVLLRTAGAMTTEGELPAPRPTPPPFRPEPVRRDATGQDPWVTSHELPELEPELPAATVATGAPEPPKAEPREAALPDQSEVAEAPGGLVRLEDLIEELFATRRLSFEATKIAEEKYVGRTIMVLGPVRTSRKIDRDFDFRDQGPGVRLEAAVGEVTGTRVGAGEVVAIAHLPGAGQPPKRGSEVLITGRILKVEALRRAIYLTDAQLG